MIEPEVEKHTKPCPDNGVEHDCAYQYIMWWERDSFDRWLTSHDVKLAVSTLREVAGLSKDEILEVARQVESQEN